MEGRGCDLIIVAPVWMLSHSDPVWSSGRGSGHPKSGPSLAVACDPAGIMTTGTQTNRMILTRPPPSSPTRPASTSGLAW